MAQDRLKITVNTQIREALDRCQARLMTDNPTATARWLLVWAIQQWDQRESAGLPGGVGSDQGLSGPYHDTGSCSANKKETLNGPIRGPNEAQNRPESGPEKGPSEARVKKRKQERESSRESLLPLDENRIDAEVNEAVAVLHAIPGWPTGINKDRQLMRELIGSNPRIDPLKVVNKLRIKAHDNPIKKRGARSRLVAFWERAEQFGQTRVSLPVGRLRDRRLSMRCRRI